MKKFTKYLLAFMIIFLQLSSPTLVIAQTVEETNEDEIIENNNEQNNVVDNAISTDNVIIEKENNQTEENNIVEDNNQTEENSIIEDSIDDNLILEEEKEEKQVNNQKNTVAKFKALKNNQEEYNFDVNTSVGENKIRINITNNYDKNFIAKVKVVFNQIQDNTLKEKKEATKTLIVDNNTIELDDIGINLNGEYNLEVNIYKLDEQLENEEEETLDNYISDKESVFNETKEKFHENNIKTRLDIFPQGSNDISCNNKECNLPINANEKEISINYNITEGDRNTTNSHIVYELNNQLNYNTLNMNFNNLLYGKYSIKAKLYNQNNEEIATDTLIINYGEFSDNEDITEYLLNNNISNEDKKMSITLLDDNTKNTILNEFIGNALSENLRCELEVDSEAGLIISNDCYGKLEDSDYLPLVHEVIQLLNNIGINATIYDRNKTQANPNDYITTKMTLKISIFDQEKEYTIVVKGDIDSGLVEDSDVNLIISKIYNEIELDEYEIIAADVNNDNNVDMLDASMIAAAICEVIWIFPDSDDDEIIAEFETENNNKININDTFKINLKLSGFIYDYINGIDTILDYDNNLLELTDYSVNEILKDYGKLKENRIVQVGKEIIEEDDIILTLTFKALKDGNTTIKLTDMIGSMDGVKLNIINNASIEIEINKETNENQNNNGQTVNFTEDEEENKPIVYFAKNEVRQEENKEVKNVVYYNNYLAKLEIDGYDIEFDKNILEYSITVDNDVDSLDITAVAEDQTSTVRIYGNSNFKVGENIVKIIVTASDGSERTYVIKVNKNDKDKVEKISSGDDNVTNNNLEKTIIIILIILVIAGLLYLIFNKDEENKK